MAITQKSRAAKQSAQSLSPAYLPKHLYAVLYNSIKNSTFTAEHKLHNYNNRK